MDMLSKGVEIRTLDLADSSDSQLDEAVRGIDVIISTLFVSEIQRQKRLIDAAKRMGSIKRFVPDDWGTACPPGVRRLCD